LPPFICFSTSNPELERIFQHDRSNFSATF